MPALVGQGLPGADGEGVPAAIVAVEGCMSCCGFVGAKVGRQNLRVDQAQPVVHPFRLLQPWRGAQRIKERGLGGGKNSLGIVD